MEYSLGPRILACTSVRGAASPDSDWTVARVRKWPVDSDRVPKCLESLD